MNLEGDDQADRSVHGGPDKAVYAYAVEETREWEAELGRELGVGDPIAVDFVSLPDHGVTVRLVFDAILNDHDLIPQVLEAPQLLPSLREWTTELSS